MFQALCFSTMAENDHWADHTNVSGLLHFQIAHLPMWLKGCRVSRIVFPTTDALESSMATAAKIGFSMPVMASTIPSVL